MKRKHHLHFDNNHSKPTPDNWLVRFVTICSQISCKKSMHPHSHINTREHKGTVIVF